MQSLVIHAPTLYPRSLSVNEPQSASGQLRFQLLRKSRVRLLLLAIGRPSHIRQPCGTDHKDDIRHDAHSTKRRRTTHTTQAEGKVEQEDEKDQYGQNQPDQTQCFWHQPTFLACGSRVHGDDQSQSSLAVGQSPRKGSPRCLIWGERNSSRELTEA